MKEKLPPSVPYEEAMADLYRENPSLALGVMSDALAEGDQETFMEVLGYLVKNSISVSTLANITQLNEKTLHRTLSRKGNPTLKTLVSIFKALKLSISLNYEKIL